MLNAIKNLIDSGIINESTQSAITEAWEEQINEARETVRSELREEYARRYEHDKSVMVEALEKMVTERLTSELSEFATDKRQVAEERVTAKQQMMEQSAQFNEFMVTKLAEEIKELRKERTIRLESMGKLEKFVVNKLTESIKDIHEEKQDVVATKVKLVAEAKQKFAELHEQFVKRSSQLVKESVAKNLGAELFQLKEDIQVARENMFGRKLFEAFATEFSVTHLNENKEIVKLQKQLSNQERIIAETKQLAVKNAKLVESKNTELRQLNENAVRNNKMHELLGTLNKEKATVMASLLENVQTDKLQSAYNKYLPAVLNNTTSNKSEKTVLAESKVEFTGDKSAKSDPTDNNVIELRRLAGLK